MPLLEEGQKIRDTYEVERFLGEGAFAEVYRVKHCFLGRQAMKVFKQVGMDHAGILKLMDEAILLSRIGHPNIVRVFDANVFETPKGACGFFTMENVSGGSLDKFWRSHGSQLVPIETTIELMRQVCRGLAIAHGTKPPVIHRDIKPQNILIGYENDGLRARLSDFGLAKSVNPLTLLASAAGTLAFKAPETFQTKHSDSRLGDIWAMGVTLYLLLTDQLPFEVDPDRGWENKRVFSKVVDPPSCLNVDADDSLDEIVMRCMEIKPEKRYGDAKELLAALETWTKPARRKVGGKTEMSSLLGKSVLGNHSPLNNTEGNKLAAAAIKLAKEQGKLFEAADLMEEAFNKAPDLRGKYASKVRLWRCGVCM
jgi:serine/threonine-protein kinase